MKEAVSFPMTQELKMAHKHTFNPESIPNRFNVGKMSAMSKQCCNDGGRYRNDADQFGMLPGKD